jgi:hypothetical protein
MNAGDTFLIPGSDDHLWMVISDPHLDAQRVVVVCFLSWQGHIDQACVVQADEHPFVKHTTCVNYPGARVEPADLLDRLRREGRILPKQPLSVELLKRVRDSAAGSDIPLSTAYSAIKASSIDPSR